MSGSVYTQLLDALITDLGVRIYAQLQYFVCLKKNLGTFTLSRYLIYLQRNWRTGYSRYSGSATYKNQLTFTRILLSWWFRLKIKSFYCHNWKNLHSVDTFPNLLRYLLKVKKWQSL